MFKKTIIIFMVTLALLGAAAVDPTNVGSQVEVVSDQTTKLSNPKEDGSCNFFRKLVIKYTYNNPENPFIYYQVSQCLKEDQTVTKEEVRFSYSGYEGSFINLPEGCPYPAITVPPAPSPCENGFQMGQVISRTVANIVTPVLTSEDPNVNPEVESPEYKEI